MGESGEERATDPLLTETFAERLGFGRLAGALPGTVPPLYLYAVAFVVLDFVVLAAYNQTFAESPPDLFGNPFAFVIPAFVLTAAFGVRYMANHSRKAVRDLRIGERTGTTQVSQSDFTVSLRTKAVAYLVVLTGYYVYLAGFTGIGVYVERLGAVKMFGLGLVVYPLGYIPIAVEFVALFASIHFLLPKRIADLRPTPSFLDPRDLGGFYPVGELLKRSYYLYTVCLFLYLCYFYGPVLTPLDVDPIARVGIAHAAYFTFLWLFGLAAIGNSVFRIHRVMAAEKEAKLRQLEGELHEIVEDPYDISSADLYDNAEFEQVQRRLDQVRAMSEYPTTTATSTQILVSVLLPQAAQVVLQTAV